MRIVPLVASAVGLLSPGLVGAQEHRPETPAEIRRIIAQAICLAEGYPDSALALDSIAVVSAYQGAFGPRVRRENIERVRGLAREARPAAPTAVDQRNFAIARCLLFAERSDVLGQLGAGGSAKRSRNP